MLIDYTTAIFDNDDVIHGGSGNGLPTADLRVSPDHAMFIDGVLFHAEALVNGATIVRKAIDSTFTYFHL
ncbi:MAG: Hint domain-containing protein, partial [Pseudomonadota bacterium]|nr:Hint domain-containing protein [Pseudomonadota bacterium]